MLVKSYFMIVLLYVNDDTRVKRYFMQVPTNCLLLCAIEAGDLLDSVKLYDIFTKITRGVLENSAILTESDKFALLDTVQNRSYNKK